MLAGIVHSYQPGDVPTDVVSKVVLQPGLLFHVMPPSSQPEVTLLAINSIPLENPIPESRYKPSVAPLTVEPAGMEERSNFM